MAVNLQGELLPFLLLSTQIPSWAGTSEMEPPLVLLTAPSVVGAHNGHTIIMPSPLHLDQDPNHVALGLGSSNLLERDKSPPEWKKERKLCTR